MKEETKKKPSGRNFLYAIIAASLLVTGISSFADAQNRIFTHYTEDGNTSFTQIWPSNLTGITFNAINGNNAQCEWQVGDNNSGDWTCMNQTNYYTCNGNTCTPVSGSSADGNNYTIACSVYTSGSTETVSCSRNGMTNYTFSLTDDTGNGSSSITNTGAIAGWPVRYNSSDENDLTILNISCTAGYGLGSINNDSTCVNFLEPGDGIPCGDITGATSNLCTIVDTDLNNYSVALSVTGTDTKTLQLSRNGMSNISASWSDLNIVPTSLSSSNETGLHQINLTLSNGTVLTTTINDQTGSAGSSNASINGSFTQYGVSFVQNASLLGTNSNVTITQDAGNLSVSSSICLNGNCKREWPIFFFGFNGTSASQSNSLNSTSVGGWTNLSNLTLYLPAGFHNIECYIAESAAAATTGVQFIFNVTNTTARNHLLEYYTSTTAQALAQATSIAMTVGATASSGTTISPARYYGHYVVDVEAVFWVQFATEVNGSAVTVNRGSYCRSFEATA